MEVQRMKRKAIGTYHNPIFGVHHMQRLAGFRVMRRIHDGSSHHIDKIDGEGACKQRRPASGGVRSTLLENVKPLV